MASLGVAARECDPHAKDFVMEEFSGNCKRPDWSRLEAKAECNQMVRRVPEAEGCALTTCQAGWASQVEGILAGTKSGTSTGPDAISSELLQPQRV